MKLLADESVDRPVISFLKDKGHDIRAIADDEPGADDDRVLFLANDQDRILITLDKDFGDLVFRMKKVHSGVILIRLDQVPVMVKATKLEEILDRENIRLVNSFTVIQEHLIRIRT